MYLNKFTIFDKNTKILISFLIMLLISSLFFSIQMRGNVLPEEQSIVVTNGTEVPVLSYNRTSEMYRWYDNALFNIHYGPSPNNFEIAKSPEYKEQIRWMIRETNATMVQFHAKSQSGYTSYPTKYGISNPNLNGVDMMRIWRDVTKEMDVKFFVYMSFGHSEAEGEAHPDWLQRRQDGSLYPDHSMCWNTPYVDSFLQKMKELVEIYDVDGFWLDEGVYVTHPCYCDRCVQEYKLLSGTKPPTDRRDADWLRFAEFRRNKFVEFCKKGADLIHSVKPECMYCANYTNSLINPEAVPEYHDYLSGDIGFERRSEMVSLYARFFDTQHLHWDIMVGGHVRGNPEPKSPDYLNQENAIVRANGGITNIWASTWPDASISKKHTWVLKQASEFIKERLNLFQGTEPVRDVGILHSTSTFYKDGTGYCTLNGVLDRQRGAHVFLLQSHYHCNLINETNLTHDISQYRVLILSQQKYLPDETIQVIRNWVKEGGSLIVTGLTATESDYIEGKNNQSKINDLLGIQFANRDTIFPGYIPWGDFPLKVQTAWYPVETTTADIVVPLLKDWDEYNQVKLQFPAVTLNRYGKGRVVYIASDIFTWYYKWQYPGLRHILAECMEIANPNKIISTDAPQSVELSLRRKEKNLIVHMINLSTDWDMDGAGAMFVESVPPIGPITSKIKCEQQPTSVILEPGNIKISFRWENNGVWVTVPQIHIHNAVVLINSYK